MSLKILVDEDSQAKVLVRKLRDAGFDVLTAGEAGLNGRSDYVVFDHAKKEKRVLLTQNCTDFVELHEVIPDNYGVFLVYKDDDPLKDMSSDEIVRSIRNILRLGISIKGKAIVFNQYRY